MNFKPVSEKLFNYLVSNLSGERFETLAKSLYSAEIGDEFIPLGGIHDGGADGFMVGQVIEGKKAGVFFQFSVTEVGRVKAKITQTIRALVKAGRNPKQVVYSTTKHLPKQDILIEEIFESHQVLLRINDGERIKQMVNTDTRLNKVFLDFFTADVLMLKCSAENLHGAVNEFVRDPTVFAFLDYELKDRFSKDHLQDKILDSLIYWALRDTDPDKNKFLDRDAIADAINTVFPTATSVLAPRLNTRLSELSRKSVGEEERVRHHKTKNLFCLPFGMRKQLAERALDESRLQDDFHESIRQHLRLFSTSLWPEDSEKLGTTLIFNSVHDYFVEQGLLLSAYLENMVETFQISDQIVERQVENVLAKSPERARISPELIECSMKVLREIFYNPSETERRYLGYLSRTSLLFMTLSTAPRMIEYFNKMGGNFRLLVGTDMLVKTLSEQQLPAERRQMESLLKACIEIGAKLVLTEPVLDEVFTHLHAVDLEYRHNYLPKEAYLSSSAVSEECDRILIRAYYYCKFDGKKISWDKFLNNFLDPISLRSKAEKGRTELMGFLIQRFKMEYLSREDISIGLVHEDVNNLAENLALARGTKNQELSSNDALMVHAVYRQRKIHKESAIYDGFGYRTWWLTKETQVLNFTGDLVRREGGVPYIMRPEFILNFIVLSPNAASARKAFRDLLPTTVGLQLGQHLKPDVMHRLLSETEEWATLPPERVAVIIEGKVNRLKYDRFKQYTAKIAD